MECYLQENLLPWVQELISKQSIQDMKTSNKKHEGIQDLKTSDRKYEDSFNKTRFKKVRKQPKSPNLDKLIDAFYKKHLYTASCYIKWDKITLRKSNTLFKKVQNTINWSELSWNVNAISILEKNQDKIHWDHLSSNVNAIYLLEKNLDKIDWDRLSGNVNAINLLEKNQDKIDWRILSGNVNAISILDKNQDKIDWYGLSGNVNAISILEKKRQEKRKEKKRSN